MSDDKDDTSPKSNDRLSVTAVKRAFIEEIERGKYAYLVNPKPKKDNFIPNKIAYSKLKPTQGPIKNEINDKPTKYPIENRSAKHQQKYEIYDKKEAQGPELQPSLWNNSEKEKQIADLIEENQRLKELYNQAKPTIVPFVKNSETFQGWKQIDFLRKKTSELQFENEILIDRVNDTHIYMP